MTTSKPKLPTQLITIQRQLSGFKWRKLSAKEEIGVSQDGTFEVTRMASGCFGAVKYRLPLDKSIPPGRPWTYVTGEDGRLSSFNTLEAALDQAIRVRQQSLA